MILWPSFDGPSARGVTLEDMGKIDRCQTFTKHNKPHNNWPVASPIKYENDSKNIMCILATSINNFFNRKINEGSNHTPGDGNGIN